jgi:hypothetical protein
MYQQHQQQQQQQNARNFERHREYLRGLKPTAKPKILDEKSTLGDMVNAVNRLSVGFSELENKKLRGFGVLPIHGMSEDPFKQILTSRKE